MPHALNRTAAVLIALCSLASASMRADESTGPSPSWAPFRSSMTTALDDSDPATPDLGVTPPIEPRSQPIEPLSPLSATPESTDLVAWTAPIAGEYPPPAPQLAGFSTEIPADSVVNYAGAGWQWQLLPSGVIWPSYWAGAHEPRIGANTFDEKDGPWLLDATLGGRAALLRYGGQGPYRAEGWELQIEGAALPRLNLDENWDVEATDFRVGLPLIYGRENLQWKFSYYHLSAHLGDELAIREDRLDERINFSRDALVIGVSYFPLPAWRWYAETGWAFHFDDGSKPWEFQFGVDVAEPGPTGIAGTPFLAIKLPIDS